jgi:hypothetical protein
MKKLILVLTLMNSLSGHAETITTLKADDSLNGWDAKWADGRSYSYGFPFSIRSDKDGICKFMGFDEAVPGSVKVLKQRADKYRFGFFVGEANRETAVYQPSPVMDENGTVKKEVFSRMIDEMKCIKY